MHGVRGGPSARRAARRVRGALKQRGGLEGLARRREAGRLRERTEGADAAALTQVLNRLHELRVLLRGGHLRKRRCCGAQPLGNLCWPALQQSTETPAKTFYSSIVQQSHCGLGVRGCVCHHGPDCFCIPSVNWLWQTQRWAQVHFTESHSAHLPGDKGTDELCGTETVGVVGRLALNGDGMSSKRLYGSCRHVTSPSGQLWDMRR